MHRKTPLVMSALMTPLLLAGCAAEVYDQDAHRDMVESYGARANDMDAVTRVTRSACDAESAAAWTEGYMDQGSDPGLLVIGVDQMCPDRLTEFEEALAPFGW